MRRFLSRFLQILLVVYLVLFGLPLAPDPLVKLINQVGITLLLGTWLLSVWRSGRSLPVTPLDAPIAALGVAWVLSALASSNQRISLEAVWLIFIQMLLFYFFVDQMRQGRQRWIIEGLFLTGAMVVLLALVGLFTVFASPPALELLRHSSLVSLIRPSSIPVLSLDNPNRVAAVCILLIPLSWAWAATSWQKDLRGALRLLAVSLVLVALLTRSRGGFLGLATIVGLELLFWLLRGTARNHLPPALHPFLKPKVLFSLTAIGFALGAAVVWQMIVASPSGNDVGRLDLWHSAIALFREHPGLGIGPSQYPLARHAHALWERSMSMPAPHAHNIILHVLAAGGVAVFAAATWLVVRFGKTWKQAYGLARSSRKRQLEGILVALLAFGVQNLVDTYLETQFVVLVACLAAYAVTSEPVASKVALPVHRRALPPLLLGGLVACQIVYIPLHQGGLAFRRATSLVQADQPQEALEAVRRAQEADPAFDLYQFQAAMILGTLAEQQPEVYLTQAIAAHEEATARLPWWDYGWHNLAALYAQAGRFDEAIAAEQQAIDCYPSFASYWFKLGEYYGFSGDEPNAKESFFEALRLQPALAAASYWTDPEHSKRVRILTEAIQYFDDKPETAFAIAAYAGDFETAYHIYETAPTVKEIQDMGNALWINPSAPPCIRCYHVRENHNLFLVESMLHQNTDWAEGMTLDEASLAALLQSGGSGTQLWYVLARMGERDHLESAVIEGRLAHATEIGPVVPSPVLTPIYRFSHALEVLPQAYAPRFNVISYEPQARLAAYYEATGDWQQAQQVYEAVVQADPYAWEARQKLQQLRARSGAEHDNW